MNLPKDFEVSQPPGDTVSSLSFSPQANLLTATSWNNEVRIYEVQPNGDALGRAMYNHDGPVLCSAWSNDGTKVFSGGADNTGRMYDIGSGQSSVIAKHDAPIKSMRYVQVNNQWVLLTGSWDKTLRYWDLRSPAPVATVNLPERCYSMDSVQQLMVVATAERHVLIYDLANPTTPFQTTISPLKFQTRVVSCFHDGSGYTIASIEGRIGIQYMESKNIVNNFTFKCHRDQHNLYAINDISFHPTYGTFSSAGSDGNVHFWDKGSKQRLKTFEKVQNNSITCTSFNRDGTIFAYAIGYDWSKGYQNVPAGNPTKIMLSAVKDEDVKPRPAKKK
ncbi:WD40-repeat-containing domain protein [Dimargaris cristalligena]|uniref:WD40-repeat-containing domain protein n=1 Tax=Dimargaris cristalligena TaxID=215637 RepID=A0A4P9ZKP9_9FUNG|nr:WD40-repeat-containing domain protein [Dimargaris cristalligena]|eukprot:RKP33673.1 WD40-repeat-containing domain protein [Dimargaris cristalligena]